MKIITKTIQVGAFLAACFLFTGFAHAALKIGDAAPALAFTDTKGVPHSFSEYQGKMVVLEWTNDKCQFVHKQYDTETMQALQQKYTAQGVIWLSVNSSAPGNEGYVTPAEEDAIVVKEKAFPTAVILDPDGTLGKAFGAKATPHIFILGKDGKLIYKGAVDNTKSFNLADVKKAHNYVAQALDEALAGKPVSAADTLAYGCSIKYKGE